MMMIVGIKVTILRNLEQFLGNTELTFTPDDLISISEVVNGFLGNDFLLNSCRAMKFIPC
jgi:hypothetical protein